MATLNEITALSKNSHLLNRVSAALSEAAEDVRNEGTGVTDHAARFAWATTVLLADDGPRNEAVRSIWLVLQNTIVADEYNANPLDGGSTLLDSDVQFVVNGIINFLAGVEV
jgi:hypothetical protein